MFLVGKTQQKNWQNICLHFNCTLHVLQISNKWTLDHCKSNWLHNTYQAWSFDFCLRHLFELFSVANDRSLQLIVCLFTFPFAAVQPNFTNCTLVQLSMNYPDQPKDRQIFKCIHTAQLWQSYTTNLMEKVQQLVGENPCGLGGWVHKALDKSYISLIKYFNLDNL